MKEIKEKEIGLAITYRKLKKVTSVLEKMSFRDDDMISFEYIIGSCFPDVYDRIQAKIRESYTQGYVDGLNQLEEKLVN